MGCYERTLAWLIEKYAGKFPTWLCPDHVRVLPISDKYEDYAKKVEAERKKNGVYVSVDARSEKIGYKIRESRLAKVPYMLVVGEKEEADLSLIHISAEDFSIRQSTDCNVLSYFIRPV